MAKAHKPQTAKSKGRRLQQRIVQMIEDTFTGYLQWGDVRSLSMGASGEDILLSPHAATLLGVSIEAKNVEKISLAGAYRQSCARRTQARGREPVVVFSRNREAVYIAISNDHTLAHPPSTIYDARNERSNIWDLILRARTGGSSDFGLLVQIDHCAVLVSSFEHWLNRRLISYQAQQISTPP